MRAAPEWRREAVALGVAEHGRCPLAKNLIVSKQSPGDLDQKAERYLERVLRVDFFCT